MKTEIDERMDDEILHQIEGLGALPAGSEDLKTQAEAISALYRAKSEEEDRVKTRAKASKDHAIDTVVRSAELILPLLLFGGLSCLGFDFEEHGCVTSSTFKRVLAYIKPKK